MIPIRESARWERPFLAAQNAVDWFVSRTSRQHGLVQLAIYPVAIVVSLVHVPFALTHCFLSLIADRFRVRELPNLARAELAAWAHDTHAKWIVRHENLRRCNSGEIADAIALPVIAALEAAVDGLRDDHCDRLRLEHIAMNLIDLPFDNSPDAHTIGLCIRRLAQSETHDTESRRTSG